MNILLAPNSFKGSIGAWELGPAMERGALFYGRIRNKPVSTRVIPISDGGTGFRRIVAGANSGSSEVSVQVEDPLGAPRPGPVSFLGDASTAIIESAEFIGLALIAEQRRNPLHTSSRPLGLAIRQALSLGATRILVGCGDSATCDGGLGLLEGLGASLLDARGRRMCGVTGASLGLVRSIELDAPVIPPECSIELACNLTSVASGPMGTARIYAQQKGASPQEAAQLAEWMDAYCGLVEGMCGKPLLGRLPGTGAAGGVAFPLMGLVPNCRVRYSFEVTFPAINLDEHLRWAEVVITGEGLFDRNSVKGKAPVALALRAKQFGCMTIAIVGAIQSGIASRLLRSGLDLVEPFTHESLSRDFYVRNAGMLAAEATTRALLKLPG